MMEMKSYKFPPEVQNWIDIVEKNIYETSEEQKLLVKHVKECFDKQDIYIDLEQMNKYMRTLERYVPFKVFDWQKFVITLHDCTYWSGSGMPRWPDLFCELGRGAGKDGTIAMESLLLASPYNGIKEYDIDICANNEEQGVRPVMDMVSWFEEPGVINKIRKFYNWTKQRVVCTKTKSIIKGRTNSPKGKDGLRSGAVIFNEIHQYENYDNINVFTTGLGKKKHPRRSYYSTNGEVREGPLDDLLEESEQILREGVDDNGLLPFICKLDSEEEVHNEDMWPKANPSLPFLPNLLLEIRKEYREWKRNPERLPAFMSKRMNLPGTSRESAAADWEHIEKTNRVLPDLEGWTCTAGIDYAKTTDWVSVNLHFKKKDQRYDINHSWICAKSKDLPRIKAPWKEWVKQGHITCVNDVEVSPYLIAAYIQSMGRKYNISMVAMDTYRHALLKSALQKVGFSTELGNVKTVSQMDILKIVPIIDHLFVNELLTWGDNPVLRWATNNTKTIRYGRNVGADKGSFVYAKIEGRSRKTDPFMAFVASVIVEEDTVEYEPLDCGIYAL